MIICPQCGASARVGKKFCGSCGTSLAGVQPIGDAQIPETGKSKIQLDKDTVNILLREFASREGMSLSYGDGRLLVDQGALKVSVNALPLKDASFDVAYEGYGTVRFGVDDLRLKENEVELDLSVGIGDR